MVLQFLPALASAGSATAGIGSAMSSAAGGVGSLVGAAGSIGRAVGKASEVLGPAKDFAENASSLYSMTPGGAAAYGRMAGKAQRKYQDAAFPGTTPWERVGAPPGGSNAVAAEKQRSTTERMQTRNLQMQKYGIDAGLIAAMAKENPSLAVRLLQKQYPYLGTVFNEKDFHQRQQMQVSRFVAETERIAQDISADRLDMDWAVNKLEAVFRDRQLAQDFVNVLANTFNARDGNPWKTLVGTIMGAKRRSKGDKTPIDTFIGEMEDAVSGIAGSDRVMRQVRDFFGLGRRRERPKQWEW